ncbi:MAG: hypothetical protein GY722_09605 [bacterium]|nr:hypothetical protein [bacterium]
MNTKNSIVIDRPIDEVFAYVTDVENMPRWVSGVRKVRLLSKKVKAGARFSAEYAQGMRNSAIDFKIAAFEPPVRFAATTERGPFSFPFRGTFEFRSLGDATEVTSNVETGDESIATRLANLLLGPLLRRGFQRRLQDELQALKVGVTRR